MDKSFKLSSTKFFQAFVDTRAHASLTEKEEIISSQRREKKTPFKDHSPLAWAKKKEILKPEGKRRKETGDGK